MISVFLKQHWRVTMILLFIAGGLFLRYDRLKQRELWNDETYQINQIRQALERQTPFWSRTATYGDHTSFPGEYITTGYFLKTFGADKWKLLIPHLFFVLLGFYFFVQLGRSYLKYPFSLAVALLIFMFNKNTVYYAFEYRPYAVLPTLVLGGLYFSHQILSQHPPKNHLHKTMIVLFFLLASIYHAYGILFVFLPMIYVAGYKYFQEKSWGYVWERLRFYSGPLVLCLWCWGWYASSNVLGDLSNTRVDTFQFIHNPLEKPWRFFKGTVGHITGAGHDWFYVSLLAPTVMTWVKHHNRWPQIWFLGVLVILPMAGILFVDIISHYWFLQRQFIWVIPLWALYLGWSWDSFYEFIRERLRARCQTA